MNKLHQRALAYLEAKGTTCDLAQMCIDLNCAKSSLRTAIAVLRREGHNVTVQHKGRVTLRQGSWENPNVAVKVIRAVDNLGKTEFTIREIADETHLTTKQVKDSLLHLKDIGVYNVVTSAYGKRLILPQ